MGAVKSDAIRVIPVACRKDERAFLRLPYELYRDDPCWVAPLRSEERRFWRPEVNATLGTRWCRRFVACRGDRPVGRIAAIVDPDFVRRWEGGTGFFGFAEFIDDRAVSSALFCAAESALRDRGMHRAIGPVALSLHNEVGLLVDGFNSPQTILTPHNPPCYESAIQDAGYRPRQDYFSYTWQTGTAASAAADRIRRLAAHPGDGGVVLRSLNPRDLKRETGTIFDLYLRSFENVWGFTPMTWLEFEQRVDRFKRFFEPDLVVIAESEGDPVGFGVVLPNINEALAGGNGRLFPTGWLRVAARARKIRSSRFLLLGVLPSFAGRGIGVLISHRIERMVRKHGFRNVELSLVLETNRPVQRVIEAFGAVRGKTFRLFEKTFHAVPQG